MSFSGAIRSFQNLVNDLNSSRTAEYEVIVLDAMALVKKRVINQGIDADGNSFGGYSEAVVPFWYARGKDGVSSNDVDRLKAKHGYFASYRDLREIKGLPTSNKNFSFTNKMWNSLEAFTISNSGGKIVIGLRTSNDRDEILEIHHSQSEILNLSEAETKLVRQLSRQRILNAFKRNGL